jgi:putative ABC transport system permease protein
MSVIWAKVWFDLWHNKVRTLLTVLSISAGVFAVGAMFGMSDLLLSTMDAAHQAAQPSHINMYLDQNIDRDTVLSLRNIKGVDDVEPYNYIAVRYKIHPQDEWRDGQLTMRDDYEQQKFDLTQLKAGRWPEKGDIAAERYTAQYYGADIGDSVTFKLGKSEKTLPVTGKVRYPFVPPPPQGPAYFFVNGSGLERFGVPDGEFGALLVRIKPYSEEYAKEVATAIKDRLGKDGVGVPQVFYQKPDKHWGRSFVEGMVLVLQVMAIASLVMSVVLVFNTLTALITQQTDQIGILKAIGGTSGVILKIYLTGVLVYGVLALFISLPLGALVAFGMSRFLLNIFNIDVDFQVSQQAVILQLVAAIIVPLLAGLIPVMQGAAITVRQAIASYGLGGDFGSNRLDRAVERIGQRLLPAHYATALGNMFCRKGRLILTQLVLITGGVMFLVVMSVSSSVSHTLDIDIGGRGYDAYLGFFDNQRIDRVTEMAQSVEGVKNAEVWYSHAATLLREGQRAQEAGPGSTVIALPAGGDFYRPFMVAGRWLEPGDDDGKRRVIVMSREAADRNKIQAGDTVTLDMHELGKENWQVAGLYQNIFGGPLSSDLIYAPQAAVFDAIKKFNIGAQLYIQTYSRNPTEAETIIHQIKNLYEGRSIKTGQPWTTKEEVDASKGTLDMVIGMMLGLAVIVAIVGGLGLMGSLSISVVERTKEIGVLRAVGARSGAIMGMFVMEGLLQGIFSWIVAVPISLLISRQLAKTVGQVMFNANLYYQYNYAAVLTWLVVVVVISTLASILPARSATRVSVRASLAYT